MSESGGVAGRTKSGLAFAGPFSFCFGGTVRGRGVVSDLARRDETRRETGGR